MSVCRKLPDGTIQKIAGHTILLDANASEIREGNITIPISQENEYVGTVTFSDPMPDNDYVVVLNVSSWNADGNIYGTPYRIDNKTTTGFKIRGWKSNTSQTTQITFEWTAWKPVKIEGYTALQNKINNPDETPTIDSMNLVTSDGVARAIENASAVWKGTKAEWNALPATTKIKYDLAVLIDTQLIKSVDRTDGTDSDVADLTNVWTGSQAEWDAMTQAQKDKWDKAMIQDGYYGITPAVLPVGCVQAYMGTVEPPGWLICNGQTFDQSVYPDLYNVLGINKVPDLRGEFLRGAGTNSHVDCGNGSSVGTHQDPSYDAMIFNTTDNRMAVQTSGTSDYSINRMNFDSYKNAGVGSGKDARIDGATVYTRESSLFASRPTNTSVNWIIFAGPAQ